MGQGPRGPGAGDRGAEGWGIAGCQEPGKPGAGVWEGVTSWVNQRISRKETQVVLRVGELMRLLRFGTFRRKRG